MSESLLTGTAINPETKESFVRETYGDIDTRLTPEAARKRAKQMFSAIGVAEACAGLMKISVFEERKGFGKPTKAECEQAAKRAANLVSLVRSEIESIPEGIEIGYGIRIDKQEVEPYLWLFWGETNVKVLLDSAKQHASRLLEAAEAAQTDNFLHRFFSQKLGIEAEEVQQILHEFAVFRQADSLKELLPEDKVPTTEKLARALEATGDPKLAETIQKARSGFYDDYKSELAAPIVQLVADLKALGHEELAQRAINGEFDGSSEESAAWFESEGKDHLPQSMWGMFGYEPEKS